MLAQCYDLHMEHVIVDWNPDPTMKSFEEVMGCHTYDHVRIVTVNGSLHDAVARRPENTQARTPKMLEYHSKNVGIRRARGEYGTPCRSWRA